MSQPVMRPYYRLSGKWGLTQLATGQPFYVDVESRDITPWILMLGRWELFVDDVLGALAEPGHTFLDVGANVGYYSVRIGGLVGPEGMVHAFEPNPELYEFVAENLNINGYHSFRAHNMAVADKVGELVLSYDRRRPGGGTVMLDGQAPNPHLPQPVVAVTSLDAALPDTTADLIKIDIEGFEPLAFAGMKGLLERSPNCSIVTEVSYRQWERFGHPATLLREIAHGKRLFRIQLDGRLVEVEHDLISEAMDKEFVSYMLILPNTPMKFERIRHLVG